MPTDALTKISALTGKRVAAGLLSWKSDRTLENTLADHRERGVFGLFDDFVLHLQEARPVDIARAERYGLRWIGSEHNRHIGGGFYHLIRNLEADYLLLLEDDLTFAVSAEELGSTLAEAVRLMEAGHMDEFLCRRDDMVRSGYEKYYRVEDFDSVHSPQVRGIRPNGAALGRWVRRTLHPAQAAKHLGRIVWFETHPERVRPDLVTRLNGGQHDFYILRGAATKWAHPAVFASRRHLLEVFDHINQQVPGFENYGKCLESLINDGPFRDWWVSRNYRVGHTKPVLTLHDRHADGGKIGLRTAAPPP